MPKKHLYTITSGRSGTLFLTNLLKENCSDATVWHERTGFLNFGVVTPDLSDTTVFNTLGNHPKVQNFWQRKFARDQKLDTSTYIETSHLLAKAGLIENLDLLLPTVEQVNIVILRRDYFKIAWSLFNRHDFHNLAFTWIFYLDPRYRNRIVDSNPFLPFGALGGALWYVYELYTRADYYKLLLQGQDKVKVIDIDLSEITQPETARSFLQQLDIPLKAEFEMPDKANESANFIYGEKTRSQLEKLIEKANFNSFAVASSYYESGRRLAQGGRTSGDQG